jgi:carboxymethylenebutenolidase
MTSVAELERVWEAHTTAEFVTCDVAATMATMADDPVVVHVPTMIGARGRSEVRRFYAEHFITHQAADFAMTRVSSTVSTEGIVDELIVSFTHDSMVDWILPGVVPTGRRVEVPLVAIVGMRDGLVASEHIYWDQASVLVQVGLVDPARLPITGAHQARLVVGDPTVRFNELLSGSA